MKKIALVFVMAFMISWSCMAEVLSFDTHHYQSHSLYGSRPFVAKSETAVGFEECDVVESDDSFVYDGTTFYKNKGSDYEVVYDVINVHAKEGDVYKDAGKYKTYILSIRERGNETIDQATISISTDGKGKKNIIVTIVSYLFTGEINSIETYTQVRE